MAKVDIASGQKGTINLTVRNADGTVKAHLGVVAISDDFPFWKRIPWRMWIWMKYRWYHNVKRVV